MTSRRFRSLFGLTVLIVLLVALAFTLLRPYAVSDWLRLRGYQPPVETVSLADDTTMTTGARHLFYVNHAKVEDKTTFRQACPKYDNQTIVIGCYQGGQRGIHILAVDDERLNGIEEVTAAHEVLHAAFERLKASEKQRIEGLLQDYADNGLRDDRIKAALKSYEVSEPGQQFNEMHSIFGTEIVELPAELEAYYARYFESRKTVAGFASRYQQAFTSRQAAIAQYDKDLKAQSAKIKSNTEALERQESEIESDRGRLDSYQATNSIDAYNQGVEPFNAKVGAYNDTLVQTRRLVIQYNALVAERNAIASQTVALQQAIDSSSLPASQ